ncbi:hypothetical protein KGA66_02125 [Actinocrinis puniceicyclus]|uniref:Uncharacterized protein n=1 Tax=Actinocrinis puniceicyclus TaxID=977794 RepID=A0A8J7WGN7_9ACTN|nr:hypothetical protein [Actinocrinis puniceicyclus]MBS2961828.1 hypothetical protein [Actinocrinis puniceicyclus]
MTALDLPERGMSAGRRAGSAGGSYSLAAGGIVEVRSGRRFGGPKTLLRRGETQWFPLVSGALSVREPVHLTVGEVAIALGKTQSVRLTLAEVTALGNRRYSVEVIASALGEDGGPDETVRLEGHAERVRGGALRVVLTGPAPCGLGGSGRRVRLAATFDR